MKKSLLFLILLFVFLYPTSSVYGSAACGEYHGVSFPYYTSKKEDPDRGSGWLYDEMTSWPSTSVGKFCREGDPSPVVPSFPSAGADTQWKCVGDGREASCFAHRAPYPDFRPPRGNSNCLNIAGYCGNLHGRKLPHDATSYPSSSYACAENNLMFYPRDRIPPNNWGSRLMPPAWTWGPTIGYRIAYPSYTDWYNEVLEPVSDFIGLQPNDYPNQGGRVEWRCARYRSWHHRGLNVHVGGRWVNCWVERRDPPGKCGTHDGRVYEHDETQWDSGKTFCERGNVTWVRVNDGEPISNPTNAEDYFPPIGGKTEWRCEVPDTYGYEDCFVTRGEQLAYDVLRGFFVVDGEIDIKFVDENKDIRDGLKVVGGLFGTGGGPSSIRLGRSLQLIDNLENPTVIIHHDARYLDIGRKIFGDTFGGGHIRDIGLKE